MNRDLDLGFGSALRLGFRVIFRVRARVEEWVMGTCLSGIFVPWSVPGAGQHSRQGHFRAVVYARGGMVTMPYCQQSRQGHISVAV